MRLSVVYRVVSFSVIFSLGFFAQGVSAQALSDAASNRHQSPIQYRTDYTDEPYNQEFYDTDQQIEVDAVITDFILPEYGHAQLYFTLAGDKGRDAQEYRAETQLVNTLEREGLKKRLVQSGQRVRLIGWPSIKEDNPDSLMLVNQILLQGKGQAIHLYGDQMGVAADSRAR